MMNVSLQQLDMPPCSGGAPVPLVMADDSCMVFGYRAANSEQDECCVVLVDSCRIFKFGYPNDEALAGHRYGKLGLGHYRAYEVFGSEWIEELRSANRIHFRHSDTLFAGDRHYIFAFHDSTLEFISGAPLEVQITVDDVMTAVSSAFARSAQRVVSRTGQ